MQKIMLVILDGFGYNPNSFANAISLADMKNFNYFLKNYPNTILNASGKAVGLPDGFIGNSEVGHITIGAGRIVETVLARISNSIKDNTFFENKILLENFKNLVKNNRDLHLMGLLSDGGVHSHEEHLYALIKLANHVGVKNVYIHAFLDGRDVAPMSALFYLNKLNNFCKKYNNTKLATIQGRFYAMDRDNNWDRTEQCYINLISDQNYKNLKYQNVLEESYKNNITDEFIKPVLLLKDSFIKPEDGVLFFNFRPDRARQLTEKFLKKDRLSFFISMTLYKKEFKSLNNLVLFDLDSKLEQTLLDQLTEQIDKLDKNNNKIFVIAETEKYAHVTYFFRGLNEEFLNNCIYKLIPSVKVENYIKHPEMSADRITQELLNNIQDKDIFFYLVNYANPDMVGHSGNLEATIKACNFLDNQLEILYKKFVLELNGTIFLTSDHGNAEEMIDSVTGLSKTSHTTNPVPFIILDNKYFGDNKNKLILKEGLGLANIAPTILKYMGLKIQDPMIKETLY